MNKQEAAAARAAVAYKLRLASINENIAALQRLADAKSAVPATWLEVGDLTDIDARLREILSTFAR